ncbi:sce7726 family protein [Companilactobacillus kimchii]|uniref:Sce7726 family protein n=2 Tax=Companilactobacillus kimchii TaxID=2801452 RepID=A0ABR5NRF6_9LACO|nr:sce7726 family protein [Companilactobacillus kimchii]KRK50532.1 hypothetical protein FC97_GL001455 [Companilactobacillus kimchii DSM 13961 = JCM 10707]
MLSIGGSAKMTADVLLNKIFTVNSLRKAVNNKNGDLYKETINSLSISNGEIKTNLDAIKNMYKYMYKSHRNEYFYKNTLINKILLGRHSVRTSTAIRELPISNNILDLLIINGIGQVYEIKTGLDNLNRLKDQLNAYYMAFSYCNVVTDLSHLDDLKELLSDTPTGIILLTSRGTLHVEKSPSEYNDKLNSQEIFRILRKSEFENIIKKNFGYLPKVGQSKYYQECFELFKTIEVKQTQKFMLDELKKRTSINQENYSYFKDIPKELKALVYFSDYKIKEYNVLQEFLNTKY